MGGFGADGMLYDVLARGDPAGSMCADISEPSGEDLALILVAAGDESDLQTQFDGMASATKTNEGFLFVRGS